MKKSFILVFLLISTYVFAISRLQEIYYGDFGEVNRVVLVSDSKLDYSILKSHDGSKININLLSSVKSADFKKTGKFKSKVLHGINIKQNDNGLVVSLGVKKSAYFESLVLKRNLFKLVIDIFNSKTPNTFAEFSNYADFYNRMSRFDQAENIYNTMLQKFSSSKVYLAWGKSLILIKQKSKAIKMLLKVKPNSKEYVLAKAELKSLGIKPKTTAKKTNKVAKKQKPIANKKVVKAKKATPVQNVKVSDTDIYKAYLTAYTAVSDKSTHAYMAASAAFAAQNYDDAIKFYSAVNQNSPLIPKVHAQLAEVYDILGNEIEAKRHRQQANSNYAGVSGTIPVWISILIGFGIALLLFFVSKLFKRKDLEPDETISDFSYHEKKIEEAYEKKPVKATEDKNIEMDFENPPIIEEPLTEDEEKQLIEPEIEDKPKANDTPKDKPAEEKQETEAEQTLNAQEIEISANDVEEIETDEDASDKTEIMDENYKRKVVLKLAQDGWDKKDIAKELKMSPREVDFIIKIMS